MVECQAEIMLARACIISAHSARGSIFSSYATRYQASHVLAVLRRAREHYRGAEITKFIGLGLDTTKVDEQGKSLLHHALDERVSSVDMNLVLLLLRHVGLVQTVDFDGMTCLHYAAFRNSERLIRALLDAGFDINATVDRANVHAAKHKLPTTNSSGRGLTPLHAAVYFRRLAATQALLEAGANPLACDASGSSPLHLAVSHALPGRHMNDVWSQLMYMPEEIWGDGDDEAEVIWLGRVTLAFSGQ